MRYLLHFSIILVFFSCSDERSPGFQSKEEKTGDALKSEKAKWIAYHPGFTYDSFPVNLYKGKLSGPQFSTVNFGGEKAFQERILNQMAGKGINFAGQFTIVESTCGAMCESIYIIDRKTGRIFADLPVNNGGRWGYRYKPGSSLLIANAEILDDSLSRYSKEWGIQPELYEWNGEKLKLLQ